MVELKQFYLCVILHILYMSPFSHSFCACIIIPSRTTHYSFVCPAFYVLCILLNVSISGKEERKAGRKEWGQREGKRKEGHQGGKEEKREKGEDKREEGGKEGRREGGKDRGRVEGKMGGRKKGREGGRDEGRDAGGTRGTKFGYRHHFCTNILLPPGDRTRIPTRLPPIPRPHFCHATLFQIPCDAVGLRLVGASLRKSFPTRYECFCRCLLTYQQLEHCLTQFLNRSRHYLIDKGVPLSTAARSQFCVTHNQTLFPFPVTSTFLARPLEGNSFSTQDKLKSWDRTIPQGSAPPHSPIHSHLPGPHSAPILAMSCSSGLTDTDPSAAVTLHQLLATAGNRLEGPGIWCQWTYTHEPLGLGPSLPLSFLCALPPHIHTQLCINTDNAHLVFSGYRVVVIAYFLNSIWGWPVNPRSNRPWLPVASSGHSTERNTKEPN